MKVILRELCLSDETSFMNALKDWEGEDLSWFTFDWREGIDFSSHLERLELNKKGVNLPQGFVANTMFYGFLGDEIIGRVHVRHELNQFLLERGGHIGYALAPRFRNKGLSFAMVSAVLPYLSDKLELDKVLITCSKENLPSVRLIEKLGAQLENYFHDQKTGETVCRFWLDLNYQSA